MGFGLTSQSDLKDMDLSEEDDEPVLQPNVTIRS